MQEEIIVVDIETTDLDHKKGHIVEIGIAKLCLKTGKVEELYNELVKEPGFGKKHKNSWIFKNSDLSWEDVYRIPIMCEEVLSELQQIFDEYRATAFNKAFDFGWLRSRGLNITELDCPMLLMTRPGERWPSVMRAWKRIYPEAEYIEKHRGLDDAMHEALIVYDLFKQGIFKVKSIEFE
jgi:DNA polymerase-3 subunit epsilon